MGEATRIIRATLKEAGRSEPLHAGPVFAAPFQLAGDPAGASYSYGRSHNPTWTELEKAIGTLEVKEGAPAGVRVFGSGMAAVAAAFGAVLRPGDMVAIQKGMYFGARQLLEEVWVRAGVQVVELGPREMIVPKRLAGMRLVWVETPSNPGLEVTDIAEVASAAHEAGALVTVDNTTATPLGQRPLDQGADLSVCSDSKAMCGHSDVLLGHVATRSEELLEKVDRQRTVAGGIAGPMEAWLLLRSLATLPLRLERSSANALGIAEFLRRQREVTEVLYPGLRTHKGHDAARHQMLHFGPVLGFTLRSREAAESFLGASQLITEATSFGGISTTAERRARWGHDDVVPGFIRLSAGCEDLNDLINDMAGALAGIDD